MDCGLVVEDGRVRTVPVSDVKAGDQVVCGAGGVKVVLPQREHSTPRTFEFMSSAVSAPRSRRRCWCARSPSRCARSRPRAARSSGSAAPASSTPAPRRRWCALVEAGYVDVLFAGNALATHDIESALYGTSLGVDLAHGKGVEHGHEHHIRAINTDPPRRLDRRGRRDRAC